MSDRPPLSPFRFLDLPVDIRLIVYELISPSTRQCPYKATIPTTPDPPFTILRRSFPVQLLATCKQIRQEAEPIIKRTLRQLSNEPVRLVMCLKKLFEAYGDKPGVCACMIHDETKLLATLASQSGNKVEILLACTDVTTLVDWAMSQVWFNVPRISFDITWYWTCLTPQSTHSDILATEILKRNAITKLVNDMIEGAVRLNEAEWAKLSEDWEIL